MSEERGLWVGVDPGEKRIGVARSDGLGLVAHPRAIVSSRAELQALVGRWQEEWGDILGVVVGVPVNMDGTIGPMARRSFDFILALRKDLPMRVIPWDERLSTLEARELQAQRGADTDRIDDQAAAVILQAFLDAGCVIPRDPPELAG